VKNVPQADVLITNPTHIAIALQYRHGDSPAPRVVAKGAGGLARRMREIAYRSNVPIVQSPVLARALFKEVEQETYVPERWYPQIAKILVWVQAGKAARGQRGGAAAQGVKA
jgi:flagellar biosynthetic protein FlhB